MTSDHIRMLWNAKGRDPILADLGGKLVIIERDELRSRTDEPAPLLTRHALEYALRLDGRVQPFVDVILAAVADHLNEDRDAATEWTRNEITPPYPF